MVILHIAALDNSPFSGVSVVVPRHVRAQQKIADVALINILRENIEGIHHQFEYDTFLDQLPTPFNHPDIVVFHQVYYMKYIHMAKKLQSENIPYIIAPHGCLSKDALKIKKFKKLIGNFLLFNSFIKGACALQCLSKGELDDVEYKNSKFISTNGMRLANINKKIFNDKKIDMTFIGRLDIFHKGIDLLLEAIYKNRELMREKNAKLNIYGPNVKRVHDDINFLIEQRQITDIVKVSEGIVGEIKKEVIMSTDVFVQTSRFEGMPMGILEALSFGVPCLVSEGTTLGYFIEKYDAGWVSQNSIDSISESITRALYEKEKYNQKSEGAKFLIATEFNWDVIAKEAVLQYAKYSRL